MGDSKKIHVLIVDDDINLSEATADILGDMDYRCTICRNGLEGFEEVKNNSYDVVLSDIKMPKMSGVEMAREIKRIKPDLPVIIMTSLRKENLIKEVLDEGAFSCIYKPLDFDHLLKLIQQSQERKGKGEL